MSSLAHHGVKGQKWGVRRYQNPDGTRTSLGKKHYSVEAANVESTRKDIKNIVQKFSKKDKEMFFDHYNGYNKYDKIDKEIAKRFIIKEGQNIVAFIDAETNRYDSDLNMVIGTAQCARGRGYATILSKKMVDWYESEGYKNYGSLEWDANAENIGSRKAAEKAGFKQIGDSYGDVTYFYDKKAKRELDKLSVAAKKRAAIKSEVEERINSDFKQTRIGKFSPATRFHANGNTYFDYDNDNERDLKRANLVDSYAERWAKKKHSKDIKEYRDSLGDWSRAYDEYEKKRNKAKHTSIGGNMNYIYGNTLVLGDSSYLEHYGIKNQKWGVRRFQNPDGSLTAAGRIRYGVTGAAKAAFKVGKKLGAATASAARAGVKKAKDNAYAKKKEKASQTREGVLKNKKMFTSDELKALENRFKIEDEMSEASLRHGQAVARTVSQYANTTRDVLSALQTGGNAVSAITKAFADIQSYKNAKGVAEAAKEKGMTTKEFDLFLKEKYPNAKKDDGSKKKDKNSNKAKDSDTDNNDDDNPPNNGGGGGSGSKKQAEYAANRQKAQEAIYAKRKADLDSRESGAKQREDYLNKRQDALVKVSKQRQSEQDARDADLNRRDKAASEREAKLKETAKTAADVMSKLNKRQADLDKKESFLNSIESYRLDTLSEFKKNEEEAARRKKKNARHSAIGEEMYTDYLEHHGIKGQRWGVRRFQNADGSLTDKGRKHYQKKLELEERKLTAANAQRGEYERWRTPVTVGMAVIGAVAGGMVGAPAGPAGIAAGAAFVSSIAASSNYALYTANALLGGLGANRSKKKIAKYKEVLAQDAFEIQNGVLIYGSGQSGELKHFGLKGMKWGVRRFQNKDGSLTEAGKQRYSNTGELDGGGGGGAEEEDEETKKKIEEAAKKAGMTVDEYRKKFADKIAAMKEKDRSWKYDFSISTKDMQRMAKDSSEFTERVSKEAHEAAMAQNSALHAGNKKRASTHGWAATQYNALAKSEQSEGQYSAKNAKRNYDSTLKGKVTKLRYATQRAKQRVYNAAGGKYKEEANTARVYREREKAKENRAIKAGNQYDAEAARSWQGLYSQSEKAMNSAYRKSIAGRYDSLKAKRKKKSAKHSAFIKDGTLCLEYHGINFPKR